MLNVIFAECRKKPIMLSLIKLSVIMLSVTMLGVIMLSVVMLNVVAPVRCILGDMTQIENRIFASCHTCLSMPLLQLLFQSCTCLGYFG